MAVNLYTFYRVRIDSLTDQDILKENIRAANGLFRDMTKAPDEPLFKRLFDALEGSQQRIEQAVHVADEVDFEVVAMGWDEGDWHPLGTRCDNEWHETTPNYPNLMVMWETPLIVEKGMTFPDAEQEYQGNMICVVDREAATSLKERWWVVTLPNGEQEAYLASTILELKATEEE